MRVTKQLRERLAISMKTQGEIEAAICEGMSRFEQDSPAGRVALIASASDQITSDGELFREFR